MACCSANCNYLVNSDEKNNTGHYCCLTCSDSSGNKHGPFCEKIDKTTVSKEFLLKPIITIYKPKAGVIALHTWTDANVTSGFTKNTSLFTKTQANASAPIIVNTTNAANMNTVYHGITETTITVASTDRFTFTGKRIQFTIANNSPVSIWRQVTKPGITGNFYISILCTDSNVYDVVQVTV